MPISTRLLAFWCWIIQRFRCPDACNSNGSSVFPLAGPALHFRPSDGAVLTWEKASLQQFFVIFRIEKWCKFFLPQRTWSTGCVIKAYVDSLSYSHSLRVRLGKNSFMPMWAAFVQQNERCSTFGNISQRNSMERLNCQLTTSWPPVEVCCLCPIQSSRLKSYGRPSQSWILQLLGSTAGCGRLVMPRIRYFLTSKLL